MEIKSISGKIFKSPNKIENSGSHTNPFGVSFKGNIINADVFEKTECQSRPSFGANIAGRVEKSRMAMSAAFGSINQALSARVNSIVNFGRRIRDNVSKTWENLNNINVEQSLAKAWNYLNNNNLELGLRIRERNNNGLFGITINGRDSVQHLLRQDTEVLGNMLRDSLKIRAEEKLAIGV